MTNRENAKRILLFDNPERVTGGLPCCELCYFGCNHESFDGYGHNSPVGSVWQDIWGVTWEKKIADVMGFPVKNPLATTDALKDYKWPDPDDPRYVVRIKEQLERFDRTSDAFLSGSHRDTLWERAYMLVGMENIMEYFYSEPSYVKEILHNITDFQLSIAKHYLDCGI